MLSTVWFKIEENRTARSEQIFQALQEKEIPCRRIEESSLKWQNWEKTKKHTACGMEEKDEEQGKADQEKARQGKTDQGKGLEIILTDDRELIKLAALHQIACVGVADTDSGFFEGADLVVEEPEKLELRELEEYLFRYHGVPVTIAQTGRLTLREMVPDDWRVLDRISHQRGMEKARRDAGADGDFEKERLAAYVRSQYRLYGYGLWTVVLTDKESTAKQTESGNRKAGLLLKGSRSRSEQQETIIGCCGFSELDMQQFERQENRDFCFALELQYMLDEAYRHQGFGTEMCHAAIKYAYEYLEAEEIWVRVRSDYPEGISFAKTIGFCRASEDTGAVQRTGEAEVLWLRHEQPRS